MAFLNYWDLQKAKANNAVVRLWGGWGQFKTFEEKSSSGRLHEVINDSID
jgi:hypothetical protein